MISKKSLSKHLSSAIKAQKHNMNNLFKKYEKYFIKININFQKIFEIQQQEKLERKIIERYDNTKSINLKKHDSQKIKSNTIYE